MIRNHINSNIIFLKSLKTKNQYTGSSKRKWIVQLHTITFFVQIDSHSQVNQPNMTAKGDFDEIYSPKKFKLTPRDDIYLDLKIKINVPNTLEPWINLLPSLKGLGLKIEDNDWVSNKTKNDSVTHIEQKFYKNNWNKKNQVIAFLFLSGQKSTDKINTKYTVFT